MRAIEQNRCDRFRRVGLLSPVFQIGALDIAQVDAMLGHQLRIAITMAGEQQTVREKLETLDQVRRSAAHEVTGDCLQNIQRNIACLRHLRIEFAGAADEKQPLAAFAAALPQKFEPGTLSTLPWIRSITTPASPVRR